MDKELEQEDRLRSEGGASCSYSLQILPHPVESAVTEGVVDECDQNRPTADQPQPGIPGSEDSVDEIQLLRRWVNRHNISQTALSDLLSVLRINNPSLPVDPRTLMKTPRTTDLRGISPGNYDHNGLEQALQRIAPNPVLQAAEYVSLQFNVDGMKPFKDTSLYVWPILGRIIYPVLTNPFLVGLYSGSKKPDNVNLYLTPFVYELLELLQRGVNIGNSDRRIQSDTYKFVCL